MPCLSEFPAQAGMNRGSSGNIANRIRVPRASGDEPFIPFDYSTHLASSPRKRG